MRDVAGRGRALVREGGEPLEKLQLGSALARLAARLEIDLLPQVRLVRPVFQVFLQEVQAGLVAGRGVTRHRRVAFIAIHIFYERASS